eukprot:CAMPEP_0119107308 /NCGR_PEP_ID=MMETSP1180-20130426/9633_1 /TAXON_ID=3052 ORGANISM="Chlamydomonas cf sp, Strain CCMP681" /NCGR_SAMPLE_ID=MMETSP1180 /ASSEMBLY_ACC=CAM_ASM_000741 /LENGTH=121 /DNA_ID=CAMNT_0007092779 /DNA_START=827 /DNA_END=1192 /DNA_ORIENTATION=+
MGIDLSHRKYRILIVHAQDEQQQQIFGTCGHTPGKEHLTTLKCVALSIMAHVEESVCVFYGQHAADDEQRADGHTCLVQEAREQRIDCQEQNHQLHGHVQPLIAVVLGTRVNRRQGVYARR